MKNLILKQNPLWRGEEDYHLKRFRKMKIKWIPKWIDKISTKPFSLNFVVGPRQTGKTTGIKILMQRLVKGVEPESVFYFDCTLLADMQSLKRVIDEYLKIRKGVETSFIFLDEVTSVEKWWKIIKGYIDMGVFENDVVTVTGSSSLKLKGEIELFPGRRGFGRDIFVLPLSFREFLDVMGIKIKVSGNIERDMSKAWKFDEEIKKKFRVYTKTGGFPLAINQHPLAEVELIYSLENELLKANKSLELSRAIISVILRKAPSPFSFSTIGKEVGISYKTVQEYVETLKSLFVLDTALFKVGKRIKWRKERKFFILDPFLARVLGMWSGEEYLESAFYEWIVQSHLKRRFGQVYYFKNRFEIDCIVDDIKLEVKVKKPHKLYPKDVLILNSDNLPVFLAVI